MPIYGYACSNCEHTFDVLQKMSDPKLVDCPDCGEATLRKQLSAPKFRLKGKGWYETDFKTGDKRDLAGDADKTASTKSKEPESKPKTTETKKSASDSKTKSA